MLKRLQLSAIIIICNYILLTIFSYIFVSNFEISFIGKWGFLSGLVLLILAVPLYKVAFFGGRGIAGSQTPQIPSDEHLYQRVHKQYEKEDENQKIRSRFFQDVLALSGAVIIVLSFFIV